MTGSRELVVSIKGGSRFRSFTAPDMALDGIATVINATHFLDSTAFVRATARLPEQDIARQTGANVATTPSYRSRQGYLDAAPGGVNIAAGAAVTGGRGAGVRVFDAEGDWELAHEDRPSNLLSVVFGPAAWPGADQDHGTAVIGVIAAADNGFGVTGIAPDASVGMIRFESNFTKTGDTIRAAADQVMSAGDILVLPITAGGPDGKMIPIEWWPDNFDAIQHATSNGVIVVAAAGNAGANLNDPIYDTPMAGFLRTWRNPLRRGSADSGSILVGAGLPPGAGLDRSRAPDSNFGSCVDAQGWSLNIYTTGYGDVQAGGDPTRFYTSSFGKTSGSSAMIAAVLACAQGARLAAGKPPWTSLEARAALRASGSPQQSASGVVTEPIGNRPDLAALIALATA